jgi:hypothetical protein
MLKNKVFCIGLGKTGTTTFGASMSHIGFKHHPTICAYGSACFRSGNIDRLLELTKDYDSFDDFPWPLIYKELADFYPRAKFVLTIRSDAETWFRSVCKHYDRTGPTLPKRVFYGAGSPHDNHDFYINYYTNHIKQVERFFEGTDRLLTIRIDDGDSLDRLIEFVGVENSKLVSLPHLKNLDEWSPRDELRYLITVGQLDHADKRAAYHAKTDESFQEWFLDQLYRKLVVKRRLHSKFYRFIPLKFRS